MFQKMIAKEVFESGLVITLVFLGFTYFQYVDYWQQAAMDYATEYANTTAETGAILTLINNNPVFQILNSVFIQYALIIGIILTVIGLYLLIKVCKRKSERYKEIGKAVFFAPIFGLIIFYVIKLLTQQLSFNAVLIDFGAIFSLNTYINPQFILSAALFIGGIIIYKYGKKLERRGR